MGEEDFLRDKSDIEVHELFSESMFDPIYRAYAEAVATVPNRREPPSLRATPKELLERIFTKVRGVDLCALTATCKAFKAVVDGKNERKQDALFLNAIEREFPGIIREVKAMEVDAGRLVAGAVRAAETRTKDDFRPNGGEIVPKAEYKRLIQNQREREEARIREESMNRMRENMSFRGQGRGRQGGREQQLSPVLPAPRHRPGFPRFCSRHNRRCVRFVPEPRSNRRFQPVTASWIHPRYRWSSSASGTRKRASLPGSERCWRFYRIRRRPGRHARRFTDPKRSRATG